MTTLFTLTMPQQKFFQPYLLLRARARLLYAPCPLFHLLLLFPPLFRISLNGRQKGRTDIGNGVSGTHVHFLIRSHSLLRVRYVMGEREREREEGRGGGGRPDERTDGTKQPSKIEERLTGVSPCTYA